MPGLASPIAGLLPLAQASTEDWVEAIAFAPAGDRVAAATADGSVITLELDGASTLAARHEQPATAVAYSADGRLASAGQDGRIAIDGVMHKVSDAWVQRIVWRPDGQLLAVAAGRQVQTYAADGSRQAQSEELPATVACVAWHPRGVLLAAGSYGGVRLLRGNGLGQEASLDWKGSVLELAMSPDGRRLAHGNQDASVHFWDLRKRSELEMWGYATKVQQLSWRHDGQLLATGGGEEVTIWNFAGRGPAGKRPLTLAGHLGQITWLGFAPASRRLISLGRDGLVLLWMPGVSKSPIAMLEVEDRITCGAWSPDGRLLGLGTASGQIAIVDADHPS